MHALSILVGLVVAVAAHHPPTVTIESGPIVGTTTSLPNALADVNQFLGVPFALSPPKRFALPEQPKQWREPLDTTKRSPACIQQINYPEIARNLSYLFFNNPAPEESEDCLYLNVFAPAGPPPPGGRAVLFWVFGGSFRLGNAGQPQYDGSHFAAYEDIIVVTVNYRTNVFGFVGSPEIPLEHRNVGFYDQRFALKWVHNNIHAFGGNPSKVTLVGESAGASSVDNIVTSHSQKDPLLYRGAIMQSGQHSYATSGQANITGAWANLTAALNCSTVASPIECVRKVPATTIKSIQERGKFESGPQFDNVTRYSDSAARRIAGNIARVPILAGSNAQDGTIFAVGQTNFTRVLNMLLPNRPDLQGPIKAAYPFTPQTEVAVINQLLTEFGFQCNQHRQGIETAATGIPTWLYYYNTTFPNVQPLNVSFGVFHSSEISIEFSTYNKTTATIAQYATSEWMRGAWARFIKNPTGGPGWNAVGTGNNFVGGADDFDLGTIGSNDFAGVKVLPRSVVDSRCSVWNQVYDEINAGILVGLG